MGAVSSLGGNRVKRTFDFSCGTLKVRIYDFIGTACLGRCKLGALILFELVSPEGSGRPSKMKTFKTVLNTQPIRQLFLRGIVNAASS